jgi:Putative zinc-finger
MNHDQVFMLLAAYADGELPGSQRREVERHVTGCEMCRAELTALTALQRQLGRALEAQAKAVQAPPDAWARFEARLAGEPPAISAWPDRLLPGRNHPGANRTAGETHVLRLFSLGFALLAALIFVWLVIVTPLLEGSVAASKRKTPVPTESATAAVVTPSAGTFSGVILLAPTRLPDGLVYMSEDDLPKGGRLTAFYNLNDDHFLTVSQTAAAGESLPGGGEAASVGSLPARLVTGQAGTLQVGGEQPRSIRYHDALRLTWQTPFGTRLSVLSDLPQATVLDFASSLAVSFTHFGLSGLPTNEEYTGMGQVAVSEGLLMEESHLYSTTYFVVLIESADIGSQPPAGETVRLSSGIPALIARGQTGTAPADNQVFFPGLTVTVLGGGGGGGGGGGPDYVPPTYPPSIPYTDGIHLTWNQGGTRLEMLSNLPENLVLKMAGEVQQGPASMGTLITGAFIDRSVLPTGGALASYVVSRPGLPADFYGEWTVSVVDAGGVIVEHRYFNNGQFAVVTTRRDAGDALPGGEPLSISGQPGVIQVGQAGTALLNTRDYDSTLQDGKPRLLLGMAGGGGTGVKTGVDTEPSWPDTLAYHDGFLVTWTLDGARVSLLTNLSREQTLQAAADITLLGRDYDVINPVSGNDQGGFFADGFEVYAPLYLPAGLRAIAPGSDIQGQPDILFWNPDKSAEFVLLKERAARPGEQILSPSSLSLNGGPAQVEQVNGAFEFRYGMPPTTITYQQATRITWIVDGTWLQILANLPRDAAVKIAESMQKGQ